MEKATLIARKSKKGKLIVEIKTENKHPMAIQEIFVTDMNMNGKECEVEKNNKGQIKRIIVEGKDLELRSKKVQPHGRYDSKNSYRSKNSHQGHSNSITPNSYRDNIFAATTPYNFVPLNKKIVTQDKPKSFDKYCGYTGYIDLEIEAKTPVYIRGTKKENGKEHEKENPEFYKQAGQYRIPGSSLRGMIRTMVEMVSWSKFSIFNDDHLYYRSFADKALSIRNEYRKRMTSADNENRSQYKMGSGLLYKKDLDYFIISGAFESIKKSEVNTVNSGRILYKKDKFYASEYKKGPNCYLVVSGYMPNKTHDWLVYANPSERDKSVYINRNDVLDYKNDRNRKSVDIIKEVNKSWTGFVPCFYVQWKDKNGNNRISFGHTPLFRISYEKSIGEHINQESVEKKKFDIAESIFGNETDFMTRIFFEDAFLQKNDYDKISPQEKIPQTLLGPKPTSFQLYLDQIGARGVKDLKHYNNQVNIRGNKLYWHQTDSNAWKNNFNPNTDAKIRPIASGAKFYGKIRFENLSDIELGALLFAVDLPKNMAHKIGMAKPLGLGSVRINANLILSNRINRYKNLFAEWDGVQDKNVNIKDFTSKFEKCILNRIGEQKGSLWETERLEQLKKMLDFEHKPDSKDIVYMALEQFKNREILPKPSNIK